MALKKIPLQGRSYRGAKGAKATFQILAKSCVFIAALKRKASLWFETNSKLIIIPCVKSREFYSVAQLLVARK